MTDALALRNDAAVMPTQNEWQLMTQMAQQLVPTGFLPEAINTPQKAVAIMLKSRELRIPFMYGLAHISVIKGKPSTDAELMLALVQRDHGTGSMRIKSSDDKHCTVEYRVAGWGNEIKEYTFSITDATRAGLNTDVWKKYPAAMLRARCISAVARMAFPAAIGGMYVAGELGDDVEVTDDGEVRSVSTASAEIIEPNAIEATVPVQIDPEVRKAKKAIWDLVKGHGWDMPMLETVSNHLVNNNVGTLDLDGLVELHDFLKDVSDESFAKIAGGADVGEVFVLEEQATLG